MRLFQISSGSRDEAAFFSVKVAKTRGRPKIRKKQVQDAKRQTVDDACNEARQLI
ncbi:hypothetical protein JG688_00017619 [Phytophthora aleatoria]|uniref:Uncharacterized protein n=1 Tax=Phytophthora aleatoria TaxID=2496075 RepID=A0A8J5M175_9STRA|nr:hypothetical protein JG688_00017619 [Phytophthora aleatoria]